MLFHPAILTYAKKNLYPLSNDHFFGVHCLHARRRSTPEPAVPEGLTPTQTGTIKSTPTVKTTINATINATPIGIKPKELEGISIQFWHPWYQEVAVELLINQFNAENTFGIEVTTINLGNNYYQEIQSGINTGHLPDIVTAPMDQIVSWDIYRHIITPLDFTSRIQSGD